MSVMDRLALVMATSLGLMGAASGQTLPHATVSQQGVGMTTHYANGGASISINGADPYTPSPTPHSTDGIASVSYWIEVAGPLNSSVTVKFSAVGSVNITSNGKMPGGISLSTSLGANSGFIACAASGSQPPCLPTSFNEPAKAYSVPTNTPIEIQLSGRWEIACCTGGYSGGGAAQGTITTVVSIDPSLKKQGYVLLFSADDNPTPVTLLSTLQDEIAGFTHGSIQEGAEDAQESLQSACVSLNRLTREIQAHSGKRLAPTAAHQLIANARGVEELIGCH